ncbi:hypothetical protein QYZ87_06310 [Porphyromonadaceae bacterium W3.11]|nr:hypothetical protein [Porphyromonadaceae bacterium W3.11]
MKIITRILLTIAIIGLGWACFSSIQGPIDFKRTKDSRDQAIIKELQDIRKAQVAYKQTYNVHAASFAELKKWLESGSVRSVRKEMELTEDQLKKGMTEEKAVEIVKKAKATGKWNEAEKEGLSIVKDGVRRSFTRDTVLVDAMSAVFPNGRDLSRFGYVPGTDIMFDMDTASVQTQSGFNIKIFQASVLFKDYLNDLNQNELANLIDKKEQLGHFPGLKVGSLTEINNNAGNWE